MAQASLLSRAALPGLAVAISAASLTAIARNGDGSVANPAGRIALIVIPLVLLMGLLVAGLPERLRTRASPESLIAGAVGLAALYLLVARTQADPARIHWGRNFLFDGGILCLPFLLFWLPCRDRVRSIPSVIWQDLAFAASILVLAESRLLATPVTIGVRGPPYATDASLFVWTGLLVAYLVLPRPIRPPFSLQMTATDLATASRAYAALMLLVLPVAMVVGFIPATPVSRPLDDILFKSAFFLIRVALLEELIVRGLVQSWLILRLTARWGADRGELAGIAVTSLLFGLAHLRFGPLFTAFACLAGAAYGWSYVRTGRLSTPVLVHTAVNLTHYMFGK